MITDSSNGCLGLFEMGFPEPGLSQPGLTAGTELQLVPRLKGALERCEYKYKPTDFPFRFTSLDGSGDSGQEPRALPSLPRVPGRLREDAGGFQTSLEAGVNELVLMGWC